MANIEDNGEKVYAFDVFHLLYAGIQTGHVIYTSFADSQEELLRDKGLLDEEI